MVVDMAVQALEWIMNVHLRGLYISCKQEVKNGTLDRFCSAVNCRIIYVIKKKFEECLKALFNSNLK